MESRTPMDKPISPLAVAGAIAAWLSIAVGLYCGLLAQVQLLAGELRAGQIVVEHRLTLLEAKVDALRGRRIAQR
jgi:hypothetical protein